MVSFSPEFPWGGKKAYTPSDLKFINVTFLAILFLLNYFH
jgi:hypothetical protein